MKVAIFCIFLLLATVEQISAAEAVFGLELGKPLNISECPYKSIPGTSQKLYDDLTPSMTCVEEPHALNGYGQPVRTVIFKPSEVPAFVKHWRLFALEADGNLIGIHFLTPGIDAQEITLQRLTEKYGPPTTLARHPVQNLSGAQFVAVDATWRSATVLVTFVGVSSKLTYGEVYIDLPAATALRDSWRRAQTNQERQF
jgi:hypothetical protein